MKPETTAAKPVGEATHQVDKEGLKGIGDELRSAPAPDPSPPAKPASKRTRGRPKHYKKKAKGAKKARPEPEAQTGPVTTEPYAEFENEFEVKHFVPICDLIFSYIARRLGNQWKLNKNELAELAVASAELANKRLPNLAEYSTEVSFALVFSAILYPRLESGKRK